MSRTGAIRLAIAIGLAASCAVGAAVSPPAPQSNAAAPQAASPAAKQKALVAVVGFENKSTYSADKLWDTSGQLLTAQLLRSVSFRVVAEWDRMKTLFEYDVLKTADIVKTPESRQKASQILLCEYFVTGAVTRFDVSQRATTSALSKKKEIRTTVRVDLMMMNPQSGEYVAQGTGEHAVVQTLRGGVTGGQTGTWDPASASEALDKAIAAALAELTQQFQQIDRR